MLSCGVFDELIVYGNSHHISHIVINIILAVHRHRHHYPLIIRSRASLTYPHFRCSIRLPTELRHVHATLEIFYKGGAAYRLTKLRKTLLI